MGGMQYRTKRMAVTTRCQSRRSRRRSNGGMHVQRPTFNWKDEQSQSQSTSQIAAQPSIASSAGEGSAATQAQGSRPRAGQHGHASASGGKIGQVNVAN
jgi:hypothetical protein